MQNNENALAVLVVMMLMSLAIFAMVMAATVGNDDGNCNMYLLTLHISIHLHIDSEERMVFLGGRSTSSCMFTQLFCRLSFPNGNSNGSGNIGSGNVDIQTLVARRYLCAS